MKNYFLIIIASMRSAYYLFLIFSFAQAVNISPYLYLSYNHDSDMYREAHTPISSMKLGAMIDYHKDKLIFNSNISYNLFNGRSDAPYDFNRYTGIGKIENNPGLNENQFNYFESLLFLSYNFDNLSIYSNISSPQWGHGVSKIIISGKAPPYFNMGYIWKLNDRIDYEHMYGKLISGIPNESLSSIYNEENRDSYYNRNIMAHRIKYKFSDNLNFYLYEIIVYGGDRNIELYYSLPFIPFLPIQTYLGDIDNDLLSLGFDYYFHKKNNIYINLTVDEWSPPYTFDKNNKNWIVYQIGQKSESIIFKDDILRCEYIWSDYRVYRHRFNINDYYSYDYSMGFWGGPHSENFFIDYSFDLGDYSLTLLYSDAKRGALTQEMIDNQYSDNNYFERYSNGFERKITNGLNFKINKFGNIDLNLGLNSIKWVNPSFILNNCDDDNQNCNDDLDDKAIIKNDYYINIKYHLKNE